MKKIIFFIFAIITLSLSSCVEENVSYDESLELTFSCDTLIMDTLFAEQQSATGRFMIYNRNKNALNIESIRMAGGKDSFFRFNIDGRIAGKGEMLEDIIIKGRDSLFVFVEMNADLSPDLSADLSPETQYYRMIRPVGMSPKAR